MKQFLLILFFFTAIITNLWSQQVFSSVDSLIRYACTKSIAMESGNIKLDQAKKAKLAAALSIPDISGNGSFSYTNNNKLPVNLFPAEIFGGQPGNFREVQSGVQYVTYGNENIDIKLVNLKGWENIRLYKLNIESTVTDNKITIKSLHENIAGIYFNIMSLQEQLISSSQNIQSANTLLTITEKKYSAGVSKQQDVNDAKVNFITTKENLSQLEYLIQQQYLALKILCDIPEQEQIDIVQKFEKQDIHIKPTIETNPIAYTGSLLKEKIALSTYKQQKFSMYPTVSFFQSATSQQFNTRGKFLNNNVSWIPSNYFGLRLNVPIPSSNTISQVSKARFDYLLAKKNTEQQKIKGELETKQLDVDYNKAVSQAKTNKEIYLLRKDTYEKNLNLYNEGIIGLEQTLNSFNGMVNSNYNLIASQVAVLGLKSKIDINNNVK
jgi:outer membrane protein TolC